ncbi:MAG TPA: ergothioneine biosynthesis glutamate--cysteine ligase EgtA [Actinomycetota bacterium]
MPARTRQLSLTDIERIVRERCVETGSEKRVGLEIEWIPFPVADATTHAPFELVERVARAAPRPAGSALTFEPGGQIELSSPPLPGVSAAINCVRTDASILRAALAQHAIELQGIGLDTRPLRRVRDDPRYRAMEAFFDADGFAGRRMMNATASIQVNLDLGDAASMGRRWRLAHAIGPVLAATFANSPMVAGAPSGWRSTRMANWWAMDATRTHPARASRDRTEVHSRHDPRPATGRRLVRERLDPLALDPAQAWVEYAMRANVMLIRSSDTEHLPMRERVPFARWVEEGHELGWPTEDDLLYHLTTLFPPVRLRGWIELRMIDALPDEWWPVAGAVAAALLDDEEASAIAERVTAPVASAWLLAFRFGLSRAPMAEAARACFSAALDALPRMGVDVGTRADAGRFYERYVARGRCPADDELEPAAREMAMEVS